MELTLVPLLLPAIQKEFGLSIGDLAWVFNTYGIAVAAGVLCGGWCGDVFNTKKVFGYGVAFFAFGSFLVAASNSFDMLIIGRMLQGFGGGMFSPLVPILLTRASSQKPGRTLIFWGSVAGYVAALAPLFYGSLPGAQNWNVAFIVNAMVAIAALLILCGSPVVDTPSPHSPAQKVRAGLFRNRDLWVTFLYVFCTYGSITYCLFYLPIRLASENVQAASVGFILSVMWLTFSGFSTVLRNLVDKPHIRIIMLAAPLLIAAALPLLFFADNLVLLVISSVFIGTSLACSNAPSTQLILRFAPIGMSAVATSIDITVARLGGIATVALLAETKVVYAATVICFLSVLAVCCTLTVSRRLTDGT
ncbi:MAG: MFS transporter [Paracoccaceae bacterium]|nr:MFS transporter [Paracoccaceae bacterium]